MSLKLLAFLLIFTGCAYSWGPNKRELPGGHKKVYVRVFQNQTQEVGMETELTNAFSQELARSGVGELTEESEAEVTLVGTIHTLDYLGLSPITLPGRRSTTLFSEYQTRMTVVLKILDKNDKEIWQGQFLGEKNYKAPQLVGDASQPNGTSLRTANPLYNQNARRQVVRVIAKDLAAEAVSRMTENF